MPDISIIMPLYNAEKYLPEALQSVLDQTYKEFELLCINDFSVDRTRSIIEEFGKRDARIRILDNEEHLGAALSRNRGLDAAEGKYILFLDGDDIFEEELLEKAYSTMEKYQTDLVLFEYLHVPDENIHIKRTVERPDSFRDNYCRIPFSMKDFEPREFLWWKDSTCNRMLRRDFLEKNGLSFQNLPSSNDVFFAQMTMFCAKTMICLDDRRVMVYARDHSEPNRISNRRDPMCAYYAMEKLCRELKGRGMLERYVPYLYLKIQVYFRYVLTAERNLEYKKKFYDFLREEGIFRCVEYGKEYYGQIDAYDQYLLESFCNYVYESRWFENPDTYFLFYLKRNGSVICDFIRGSVLENKRIYLWGVGINGTSLLDYLWEHSIRIFGAVDGDQVKQGTIVSGYEIADPAVSIQNADYIIVTSKELCREVVNAVRNTRIVVINLLDMLKEGKADL